MDVDGISILIKRKATCNGGFSALLYILNHAVFLVSAFAVSSAFALGGHLAFTMVYNGDYVVPMIVGKLVSGLCALVLALVIYKDNK